MNTTRAELKSRAKAALKGNYAYSVVLCLIVMLIAGIIASISVAISLATGFEADGSYSSSPIGQLFLYLAELFIVIPISVGLTRFFIQLSKGSKPEMSTIGYVFKNGLLNTVGVIFVQSVYIMLWSLLFIVPGIIKSYQYYMITYLLAENPKLERKRAFEITKAMMKGNKWRAFVLGLSFIGWALLCSITFGIGYIFLVPYMNATFVEFYLDLKKQAIEAGVVTEAELSGEAAE